MPATPAFCHAWGRPPPGTCPTAALLDDDTFRFSCTDDSTAPFLLYMPPKPLPHPAPCWLLPTTPLPSPLCTISSHLPSPHSILLKLARLHAVTQPTLLRTVQRTLDCLHGRNCRRTCMPHCAACNCSVPEREPRPKWENKIDKNSTAGEWRSLAGAGCIQPCALGYRRPPGRPCFAF